jgi:hypothetical protein
VERRQPTEANKRHSAQNHQGHRHQRPPGTWRTDSAQCVHDVADVQREVARRRNERQQSVAADRRRQKSDLGDFDAGQGDAEGHRAHRGPLHQARRPLPFGLPIDHDRLAAAPAYACALPWCERNGHEQAICLGFQV